jgi:hypothetical protein
MARRAPTPSPSTQRFSPRRRPSPSGTTLDLTDDVDIQGRGANLLAVQESTGAQTIYVFTVASGVSAFLRGMTIANGFVGIYSAGTTTLANCALTNNLYGADNLGGTLTVTGCTASGNDSTAIYGDGTTNVTNSTLQGNYNGIYASIGSAMTIANCTVNSNSNYGIYNPGAAATIKNTIATNNSTGDVSGGSTGTFVSGGYNLIGDGSAAPGFMDGANGDQVGGGANPVIDAKLAALADNGGPTQTMALLSDSPALDAGAPAFAPPPSTDQRGAGFPRVQGSRLDIGAFEAPVLQISDKTVSETNAGSANAIFTVTLSAASTQIITVDCATANGTATAGADYTATSGTLTFNPGQTSKSVTVPILGDTLDEDNETFVVNLSNAAGATIDDAQGAGTIADNDASATVTIDDVAIAEGNTGTSNAVFTVSLNKIVGRTVTVRYATTNALATAGADYIAASGTLTFNPGETTKTISVPIIGDLVDEANETFKVNLSGAVNALLSDSLGQGTITDDDAAPTLSIGDATAVSEDGAGAHNLLYTVTLSGATNRIVKVNYATSAPSVSGYATSGVDFTAVSGTITFNPGQTSKTIVVPVLADTLDEVDEIVRVNLSNPSFATIADSQGQGTIADNDASPSLSINDIVTVEGTFSGGSGRAFTVTLSAVSGRTVTVSYATANGTAVKPGDYTGSTGTLTFAPGQTTQTLLVGVYGDSIVEPDETFFVDLSNATGASINKARGTGTITNDDSSG